MEYKELSIGLSLNVITGESWWKCDAKTTVEPGEDIFQLAEKIKADIAKIIQRNPIEEMKGTVIKPVADEPRSTVDALIADINSCTELKVLESYRLIAKSNAELLYAYDNKLKQLQ